MSVSTKVTGTDTSLLPDGGVLIQTFRDLMKQREALDRDIKRLLRFVEKQAGSSSPMKPLNKKIYVARMKNNKTVKEAILSVMTPGIEMKMDDVLEAITKAKAYNSRSHLFYTQVNNKLHEMVKDGIVKKPEGRRGVFMLPKRLGRSIKVAG